jgi:hypothetical protein
VSFGNPIGFSSTIPMPPTTPTPGIDGNDQINIRTLDDSSTHVYAIGCGGMDDIHIYANVIGMTGDHSFINILTTPTPSLFDLAKLSIYYNNGPATSNINNDQLRVTCPSLSSSIRPISRAVVFGGTGNDIMDINCSYAVLCGDTCTCMYCISSPFYRVDLF